MSRIRVLAAFMIPALIGAAPAEAKKPARVVAVEVRVVDVEGEPVSTAVVRATLDGERHRVNVVTGAWQDDGLFLRDGSHLPFVKGTELEFEVSAPDFQTELVRYRVRRRRNVLVVTLTPMDLGESPDPGRVIVPFKRDLPVDGEPVSDGEAPIVE